jgi:Cof subfamily protein (haloacid dehalogenase superfamily)
MEEGSCRTSTEHLRSPPIWHAVRIVSKAELQLIREPPGARRPASGANMNNSHRIQLVLADVDGTLVTPDKTLTERARAAIRKLGEANIAFAVTSGRPPRGMAMLLEPLGLRTPIAGFNGGAMVSPDMTSIEIKAILPKLVSPIVRNLLDRGLDAWIYQWNEWFLRDPTAPHADREQRTVQFAPVVVDDLENRAGGVVKIVGVTDDRDTMEACENELRERFGDRLSIACSQPYYVDITHPAANKGEVLRRLSREFGIPPDAIATVGDMPNDVLMFALSGLSIAMGQASEDVKRSARRVTKPNTQDGFAEAIERYVLNEHG